MIIQDKGIQEKLITGIDTAIQLKSDQTAGISEKNALQNLHKTSLPNARDEDWRYANLDFLLDSDFSNQSHVVDNKVDLAVLENIRSDFPESSMIVFLNGMYTDTLSQIKTQDIQSIILDQKFNHKINLEPSLDCQENPFFLYLNQSNPSSHLDIEIKGDVAKGAPLQIVHMHSSFSEKQIPVVQPSLTITLSANCTFNIVEHFLGKQENHTFWNGVTQVILKENSILDYQKVQNENSKTHWLSNTIIYQGAGSQLSHGSYLLGSTWARNSTQVMYSGMNTHTSLYGVAIGNDEQYMDHSIKLNHTHKHASSDQLFKFVLDDHSKGTFNGKIFVQKGASTLSAQQNNHNLLVSDTAEMNAKPQLEILNDDVKCSHGSTIGQLDEEALFYMRSRGINEKKAQIMLTEAFVMQVVDKIKSEPVQQYIKQLIRQNWLNQ